MGRIRPVRLDRHDAEAVVLDQVLRDGRPRPIELGCAMRGLAEQHDPGIPEPAEMRPKFSVLRARQWLSILPQEFGQGGRPSDGGMVSLQSGPAPTRCLPWRIESRVGPSQDTTECRRTLAATDVPFVDVVGNDARMPQVHSVAADRNINSSKTPGNKVRNHRDAPHDSHQRGLATARR
jgi:hypothetical protein